MLFIGALSYAPNQDAVRWFLAEILPALRAATPCELLVAGRHAPESLRALLASSPGVVFLGPVEYAASAYQDAHLVVAPLRAGGGTRLKILEAFALGRPVVATPLAAEGLEITPGRHALLADRAADFAAACAKLAADADLRRALAAQAREWIAARHSPSALAAPLA
jgi:glycosyltransferase involved in cell wall biosynthesis